MSAIDRVVVDFAKTFSGPGLFLGIEPKMERADKNDPNSQELQARDKNNGGALKWTATVAVKYKPFSKDRSEILSLTLLSPTQPCSDIPLGQTVMIEGLEMGIMRQDRGGIQSILGSHGYPTGSRASGSRSASTCDNPLVVVDDCL